MLMQKKLIKRIRYGAIFLMAGIVAGCMQPTYYKDSQGRYYYLGSDKKYYYKDSRDVYHPENCDTKADQAKQATSKEPQSSNESADNTILSNKVKMALEANEVTKDQSIHVKAIGNQVILSGYVNKNEQRLKAIDIASKVPGVQLVVSQLMVKLF